jgi:hypothetical protein
MPELSHAIMLFEPKPDPLVEQMKQLQIQKEMKEIEKLQSEIDLNLARAKREETTAEKTALETVEQETGTKHARDMEKQAGQAMGNQALAVTKALVTPRKYDQTTPDIEAAIGYNELTKMMHDPRTGPTATTSPYTPGMTSQEPLDAAAINAMAGPAAGLNMLPSRPGGPSPELPAGLLPGSPPGPPMAPPMEPAMMPPMAPIDQGPVPGVPVV